MVSVVNNVNNNMKISKAHVGIITPPDYAHTPKLVNTEKTEHDNTSKKHILPKDKTYYSHKTKTPAGIVVLLGIGALAVLSVAAKSFISRFKRAAKP